MANLIIPRRVVNIINSPYIIDKTLPICKNLLGAYYSGESNRLYGYDLLNNKVAEKSGPNNPIGYSTTKSNFGELSTRWWSASNNVEAVNHPRLIGGGTARTVLWIHASSGATTGQLRSCVGSGFTQPGLYDGYGGTQQFYLQMRMSDGSYYAVPSISQPVSEYLVVMAQFLPSVSLKLWVNGVLQGTTDITGLTGYESAWHSYVTANTGQAGYGVIPLMYTWDRALSGSEMSTISINPFSILKSTKNNRIYFDLAATTDPVIATTGEFNVMRAV